MTRIFSKSYISAYASALASASRPPGLEAVAAALDEFCEVVAKSARALEMARLAPPPMTTSPVISLKANLAKLSRDLRRSTQSTCDCCCHYQATRPDVSSQSIPSPLNNFHVTNTHTNTDD